MRSTGLAPKHRKKRSAAERELEALRRRNAKARGPAGQAPQALEIQGKASELLARLLAESTPETDQQSDEGPKP